MHVFPGVSVVRPPVVASILALLTLGVDSPGVAQALSAYHLKLEGTLSDQSFVMIGRVLQQVKSSGAAALVVELDADGDDIDLAEEISSLIADASIAVFAYVSPRALNAAALVALATDSIYMSADATLGGNEAAGRLPFTITRDEEEILVSDLFGDYAAAHGVDRRIGAAMVDPTIQHVGLGDPNTRILLTTERALGLGLAVAEATSLDVLLAQIKLSNVRVEMVDNNWLATTIRVENNNWHDIDVFTLLSGGMRIRMGTVTSMNSSRFTVPGHILFRNSYIRVVAEIIGSDDSIETEIVRVMPGLVIEWRIENVLTNSNYFVWTRN